MSTTVNSPLESIPRSEQIRQRLNEAMGEVRLLRQLLKVAIETERRAAQPREASR